MFATLKIRNHRTLANKLAFDIKRHEVIINQLEWMDAESVTVNNIVGFFPH